MKQLYSFRATQTHAHTHSEIERARERAREREGESSMFILTLQYFQSCQKRLFT